MVNCSNPESLKGVNTRERCFFVLEQIPIWLSSNQKSMLLIGHRCLIYLSTSEMPVSRLGDGGLFETFLQDNRKCLIWGINYAEGWSERILEKEGNISIAERGCSKHPRSVYLLIVTTTADSSRPTCAVTHIKCGFKWKIIFALSGSVRPFQPVGKAGLRAELVWNSRVPTSGASGA